MEPRPSPSGYCFFNVIRSQGWTQAGWRMNRGHQQNLRRRDGRLAGALPGNLEDRLEHAEPQLNHAPERVYVDRRHRRPERPRDGAGRIPGIAGQLVTNGSQVIWSNSLAQWGVVAGGSLNLPCRSRRTCRYDRRRPGRALSQELVSRPKEPRVLGSGVRRPLLLATSEKLRL
jgi:hypothetical protein